MRLAIELYGTIVRHLGGDRRTFDFTPSAEGMERFGGNSSVLSVAVPLQHNLPRHFAGRRRNWFIELLPEGDQYEHLLRQGNLPRGDTLSFLARYGRDVAGALQIWDEDDPTEPPTPTFEPVTDAQIRELLEDPIGSPLANTPGMGKTSLNGVQPKIVLAHDSRGWSRALGGVPSTHILKPRLDGARSTMVFDEEYGAQFARALGLADFDTRIVDFAGLQTLIVERYDRVDGTRVHQEDFNQALGAAADQKYQEMGGVVSLRRMAAVISAHTSGEELHRLARLTVLNVALGNLDAHTKNFGLVHLADGQITLAPAYDVVPLAHVGDSDGRLALSVNGQYQHAAVSRDDLVAEIASWGVRRAEGTVATTLSDIREALETLSPLDGAHAHVEDFVRRFATNLASGRAAGDV
ncbi:hypothetical protein GCM10010401_12140 [Rarobacter faecitabidus]|uniref:Serine/threonine-protein kinase HipA n=1 Tax=Rarobacter faecitabidus TaxID=13243 RepID=A0A542ZNW6_RARFA|nr:HipA domain-containing protein [Rarobacter faecitabidus]TQL62048.1 serine/threonine-protein kinase HipA [Rarobacter faecitabidus]